MNRLEAKNLKVTHPYPDTLPDGRKKFNEEVWIDAMYGQPTREDAHHQMRKVLQDYRIDYKGFYLVDLDVNTGEFEEVPANPSLGYGKKRTVWRYFIHFAQYR